MTRADRDAIALRAVAGKGNPGSSGWIRVDCPFCVTKTGKPDHRQSFGVMLSRGSYHCFKCGTTGRIRGLAPDLTSESVAEEQAREALASKKAARPPDKYLPLCEEPAASALSAAPAREYLRARGLPEKIWEEARIGVCLTGRYAGRVVIPILDGEGAWVGWVARAWVKGAEVPYLYPPGMPRGGILYNQAALAVETHEPVFVVEGCFDALAYWPNAVAVLGKPSEPQIALLVAARRPVVVVLDGDAHEEGWALGMRLRLEGQVAGSVRLPPRVDPDEISKSWLREEAQRSLEAT